MVWYRITDNKGGVFYVDITSGRFVFEISNSENSVDVTSDCWYELYDLNHKRPYYYHLGTKQTVWTKPKDGLVLPLTGLKKFDDSLTDSDKEARTRMARIVAGSLVVGSSSTKPDTPPAVTTDKKEDPSLPPLAENWMAIFDTRNNRFYYANTATKQTTWFRKDAEAQAVELKPVTPPVVQEDTHEVLARFSTRKATVVKAETSDDAGSALHAAPLLPDIIKSEIHNFQFDGFARKYFSTHKKGVFRREVPMKELLEFSKASLEVPLLSALLNNKTVMKEALNAFKHLQMYMGDRPVEKNKLPNAILRELVDKAINQAMIRDELYCQAIKQCTGNASRESLYRGWECLVVYVGTFPPTRDFTGYVFNFLNSHFEHEDEKIRTYSTYCARKLPLINIQGARGRVPSADEIDTLKKKPFNPTSFGSTLPIIMELQKTTYPDLAVPIVLTTLTDAIVRLGGCKAQGIFRVPGDTEESFALKLALEQSHFIVKTDDPHVPASILKLWLRELDEPLIPNNLYDRCIHSDQDPAEISNIVKELPEINRNTLMYLVRFLQIITAPANVEHTKMTVDNVSMVFAPNFLRCPSDDPGVIFENTKTEQQFVKSLLLQLKPDEYVEQ